MLKWWTTLSVSKKLYSVVGAMALLVTIELIAVISVMDTLSGVRALISGEGIYTEAQKNAFHSVYRYLLTSDERYYREFKTYLLIPKGDRIGRQELAQKNPDLNKAKSAFLQGGNHPDDIDSALRLLTRYSSISYIKEAFSEWENADQLLAELELEVEGLHSMILEKRRPLPRKAILGRINAISEELSQVERRFSTAVGDGARWVESVLVVVLVALVFTVGAIALFLTLSFGRTLSQSLNELSRIARKIGKGDFETKAHVPTEDDLGDLARSLNSMGQDLKTSIEEIKKAESASQTKTLFLANMSHEIRTPLGIVLGLAEILKANDLSEEDRISYVNIIERTGQNLSRIINDILDLSKVESGFLEVEKAPFSLAELLTEIQTMLQISASERNIEFSVHPAQDLPTWIISDRTRLSQILTNLIGNAIKFTEIGQVTLECWWQAPLLYFRVKDSGIGISAEQKKSLFKNFSQADPSTTRKFGGTGLGLVLSKRLANALGGDIIIENSTPGEGTSFLVSIAPKLSEKQHGQNISQDSTPTNGVDLSQVRVLIVDDSKDNQLVISHFMKKWKVRVDLANDGLAALEKVGQNSHYDLIFMDMQMPRMDGYTSTAKLREAGFKKPIIALTAHALKEDRERCLASGCDEYISKPVSSATILQTLQFYCDPQLTVSERSRPQESLLT